MLIRPWFSICSVSSSTSGFLSLTNASRNFLDSASFTRSVIVGLLLFYSAKNRRALDERGLAFRGELKDPSEFIEPWKLLGLTNSFPPLCSLLIGDRDFSAIAGWNLDLVSPDPSINEATCFFLGVFGFRPNLDSTDFDLAMSSRGLGGSDVVCLSAEVGKRGTGVGVGPRRILSV